MPLSEDGSDIELTVVGERLLTVIQTESGKPVRIWMTKKAAARYTLMLQQTLRGMNGESPLPDHPGWTNAP